MSFPLFHEFLCLDPQFACREQFACRGNDRILGSYRNKVVKFGLPVRVTSCNADHIVRILSAHVRIFIDKCCAHTVGMIFIGTKYNGLRHTVCAFQILSYFMCYFTYAVFNDYVIIVVGVVIDAVFYQIAVNITLSFDGPPFIAYIGGNVNHFEWSQKTVLDTLFHTVCVDRFTEIADA